MCLRVVFKGSILYRFDLQGCKPFKCFSLGLVRYLETESPWGVAVHSCSLFCSASKASQIPETTKYGNNPSRTFRWSLNSSQCPGMSGLGSVCFKILFGPLSEKPGLPKHWQPIAPKLHYKHAGELSLKTI